MAVGERLVMVLQLVTLAVLCFENLTGVTGTVPVKQNAHKAVSIEESKSPSEPEVQLANFERHVTTTEAEDDHGSPTNVNKILMSTIPGIGDDHDVFSFQDLISMPGAWSCDSPIYCRGPLLDAVQRAQIFEDSKTFVDMPLKYDPVETLAAFEMLVKNHNPLPKEYLRAFIRDYFHEPGMELEPCELSDWVDSPDLLDMITDKKLKNFAHSIHTRWFILSRRIKDSNLATSNKSSLLYVPNEFILPGDRFREFYYWDTFWIVKGLLASGMMQTTRRVIENLLYMVKQYGFVPNGGRIYYTNRSQPPLLASMLNTYYEATKDIEFVSTNLPLLEKEYAFWVNKRSVNVYKDGRNYTMGRYRVDMAHPRAEGYMQDLKTVRGMTLTQAAMQFSNLASGAESGWDYSTRWFSWQGDDEFTLRSVMVGDIIPVDLNAFLYLTEDIISKFANITGDVEKASRYADLALERKAAIDAIMWHEQDGIWYDYDMSTNTTRRRFFLSNITPLLIKPDAVQVEKVINYLQTEGVLGHPGGVPTSSMASGQQWDFPNAWAPLIDILVTGLEEAGSERAQTLARNISHVWVLTNYAAWVKSGHMYEKYMVRKLGGVGGGGEYKIQLGFGWTNGVVLHLLNRYGNDIAIPKDDLAYMSYDETVSAAAGNTKEEANPELTVSMVFIPVVLLVVSVLAFICFMKRNMKQ